MSCSSAGGVRTLTARHAVVLDTGSRATVPPVPGLREARPWISRDATNLHEFGDASFDIAFSNSVIEHLSTFENQARMAAEVRRVARAYWVQTPNFWFPIEPHFLVPAWHWLPGWLMAVLAVCTVAVLLAILFWDRIRLGRQSA